MNQKKVSGRQWKMQGKKTEVAREREIEGTEKRVLRKYRLQEMQDRTYRLWRGDQLDRKVGFYVPSEEQLGERYRRDMEKGRLSSTTTTFLSYMGLIHFGIRSVPLGREAINVGEATIKTRNGCIRKRVSRQEELEAIHAFILQEDVKRYMQGTPIPSGKRMVDFREQFPRVVAHLYTHHDGLRGYLEKLPEYKGFYKVWHRANTLFEDINPGELGKVLLLAASRGQPLSASSLKYSPVPEERRIGWQVRNLLRHSRTKAQQRFKEVLTDPDKASEQAQLPEQHKARKKKNKPKTQAKLISWLTGLKVRDIEISRTSKRRVATLGERLVEFYLRQAFARGIETFVQPGEIYRGEGMLKFACNGKGCYADLRVGNHAIEVKGGLGRFYPTARNFFERYSEGNCWQSGEPIEGNTVVFVARPEFYTRAVPKIERAGINIVRNEEFHQALESLVSQLKKEGFPKTSPRLHDPDYLVRLHEEICLAPHFLLRPGNSVLTDWARQMVQGLIRGKQGFTKELQPQGSSLVSHEGRKFLLVNAELPSLDAQEIRDYIGEHKQQLTQENMQGKLQISVPRNKMLFVDLETCGFKYFSPIVSIGLAHFSNGDLKLESLVARDPSEERAILHYFFDILPSYDAIFTFNGLSFDLPKLTERAKHNGILLNPERYRTLTQVLGNRHVDLLHLVREHFQFNENSLSSVEKKLFYYEREHDVPGDKIPEIYYEYVWGHTKPRKITTELGDSRIIPGEPVDEARAIRRMQRVVEHNILDAASLVAILTKLCS